MIRVVTGARLHAGFYTVGMGWGVAWGGSGFYIDGLGAIVEGWECDEPRLEVPEEYDDVAGPVRRVVSPKRSCARLVEAPPRHVGLGSTTQTSLALAMALLAVEGMKEDPVSVAHRLGRNRYSLVGSLLFKHGGFIIDPGTPSSAMEPLARVRMPETWRFIVVIPSLPRGMDEEAEKHAMTPKRPSDRALAFMAHGTLMLASALLRSNLEDALNALSRIQMGTGLYFSSIQKGVYRGDLARIVDEAQRNGMVLAQSSWGPTLYTISEGSQALSDSRLLKQILDEAGIGGRVFVVNPRNHGASILGSRGA